MMKNAVIIHGKPGKDAYYDSKLPSPSNFAWIPWLQKQLLINEISTATPEMFHAFEPDYAIWKKELERYDVSEETLLVGHSCATGFLLRWLSENPDKKVGKVILVAPSLGFGWEDRSFFDFEIDPTLTERVGKLVIFHSDNDKESAQEAAKVFQEKLPNHVYREFHNYGHFTELDMPTNEFPELLKECLQ
jgi:uncharacterized protein